MTTEKIFKSVAKKIMVQFSAIKFMDSHPKLLKVILSSMQEYADQEIEPYKEGNMELVTERDLLKNEVKELKDMVGKLTSVVVLKCTEKVLLKQLAIEGYDVGYNRAMTKYGICENDREFTTSKQWSQKVENIKVCTKEKK